MDGPQNGNQGFTGYGAIPGKDSDENAPWPPEDRDWESVMTALFALMVFPLKNEVPINLPMLRWGREVMHPRDYANMNYYDLWLLSVVMNCIQTRRRGLTSADFVRAGIVSQDQIDRATAIYQAGLVSPVPGFGRPDAAGKFTSPHYPEDAVPVPRFAVGDRVRGILQNTPAHTRQYSYWRGRVGVIDAVYPTGPPPAPPAGPAAPPQPPPGTYTVGFDDVLSRGKQEVFVPLYSVKFRAEDLWGDEFAEPDTVIYSEQFEPYIRKE